MKAKIARVNIDVDYRCPNCYLHFRLSNKKIPQSKPMNLVCPECSDSITIPPLFNFTKKKSTKKPINNTVEKARAAMRGLGFSNSEVTALIEKTYQDDMLVADLIEGCLKNVEQSKTE